MPSDILAELVSVTHAFVEESRPETEAGRVFDIGPGHSKERPVLRCLKRSDDQHEAFWRFASGFLADVAADLAGPDVLFEGTTPRVTSSASISKRIRLGWPTR